MPDASHETTEQIEVPLRSWMSRRWLKPGNCLSHARQLLGIPEPHPYLVCMGPFTLTDELVGLHCWLEAEELVVDLTRKPKFWSRRNYYFQTRIIANEVRRYSPAEVGCHVVAGECCTFWDFDVSKYVVYNGPSEKAN